MDLGHLRLEGVCQTFTVVHLDVNLDKLETEGQRLGLNRLYVVVVVTEGRNRLGEGVRVNIVEAGNRVHFLDHHYHAHAITSGTHESAVGALVQHALVSHTRAATNREKAPGARERGGSLFSQRDA